MDVSAGDAATILFSDAALLSALGGRGGFTDEVAGRRFAFEDWKADVPGATCGVKTCGEVGALIVSADGAGPLCKAALCP